MSANAPSAAESRSQPESSSGKSMTETELANAAWWSWFWGQIEQWAFLLVVVFLAIEFAALKFGAPFKEKIERARETRLVELSAQTAEAQARQKEAEQRAEELRAAMAANEMPRQPNGETFLKEMHGVSPGIVSVIYDASMADSFLLAISLRILMNQAGWHVVPDKGLGVTPLASVAVESTAGLPVPFGVPGRGSPYGIAVIANRGPRDNDATDPIYQLAQAILRSKADSQIGWGVDKALPDNFVKLVIGHKARGWIGAPTQANAPVTQNK